MKRAALVLLLCCGAAHAAAPAAATPQEHPAENPAVDTLKAKKPAAPGPAAQAGTTIVGDGDSDVGLYLTPWREEHADNIDPPPGLHTQAPEPVDPRRFGRTVRDSAAIDAYRRQQMDPNR